MPLKALNKENLDPLNELGIKLEKPKSANVLSEMLLRVARTYVYPNDFLQVLKKRIHRFKYIANRDLGLEKSFNQIMKKLDPGQVIAIANCGIPIGSLALYNDIDTRIVEAHDEVHWARKYKRNRQIEWRSYLDGHLDVKRGVMEIDELKPTSRTVVVDEHAYSGYTLKAVIDHLKEKGIEVEMAILYDCHNRFKHQHPVDYILLKDAK